MNLAKGEVSPKISESPLPKILGCDTFGKGLNEPCIRM